MQVIKDEIKLNHNRVSTAYLHPFSIYFGFVPVRKKVKPIILITVRGAVTLCQLLGGISRNF